MKTLNIDQIKFDDDFFLKEVEDLLPEEFFIHPEAYIWFYNIIKDGIRKEDRNEYPCSWFLFDNKGNFILECNESKLSVYIHDDRVYLILFEKFKLTFQKIEDLFVPMLKQLFKCNGIDAIMWKSNYYAMEFEKHFKIKD